MMIPMALAPLGFTVGATILLVMMYRREEWVYAFRRKFTPDWQSILLPCAYLAFGVAFVQSSILTEGWVVGSASAVLLALFVGTATTIVLIAWGKQFADFYGPKWIKALDLIYVTLGFGALVVLVFRYKDMQGLSHDKSAAKAYIEAWSVTIAALAVGVRLSKSFLELFFEKYIGVNQTPTR